MSQMFQLTPLEEIVALSTEKVVTNKDPQLPYIGLEHIAQGFPKFVGTAESMSSISTNSVFAKDDILFGKLRPNLRKSIKAPFQGYCSTDILVLRCFDGIDPGFAGHLFQWEQIFAAATATAAGTKMPRTSWNELKRFKVFKPPTFAEQSRIAAVLDTVDAAIAQTEAIIAKLKQVRAGLLHDLLTRGLDEHGQLRPPPAEAPHLYQDSLLGKIPRKWELRMLSDCLASNPQNGIYKPAGAIGRGTLLIGQTSITADRSIDVLLARRAEISVAEREHYRLQTGDILVSRVFATLDGVGQPALVPDFNEPAVYESNMMRLRVRQAILAPILLFHWLRSVRIRKLLLSGVNLSNQASVNQQALNRLPVVVPSICEQKRKLDTIRAIDEPIQANSLELGKLYHLKSALMSDLLTGRVRVPADIFKENL